MVEVDDDGEGLLLPNVDLDLPDADTDQGRGLWLVKTFSDDVEVVVAEDVTRVRAIKRAVAAAGNPS